MNAQRIERIRSVLLLVDQALDAEVRCDCGHVHDGTMQIDAEAVQASVRRLVGDLNDNSQALVAQTVVAMRDKLNSIYFGLVDEWVTDACILHLEQNPLDKNSSQIVGTLRDAARDKFVPHAENMLKELCAAIMISTMRHLH